MSIVRDKPYNALIAHEVDWPDNRRAYWRTRCSMATSGGRFDAWERTRKPRGEIATPSGSVSESGRTRPRVRKEPITTMNSNRSRRKRSKQLHRKRTAFLLRSHDRQSAWAGLNLQHWDTGYYAVHWRMSTRYFYPPKAAFDLFSSVRFIYIYIYIYIYICVCKLIVRIKGDKS